MTAVLQQKKEGGERIQISKKRPWGAVPEGIVVDTRMGTTARLVGIWLCIRPPGWVVRRGHLLSVLGIGLDAWWRARKQLLELGYLVEHKTRQGGRFTNADLEFFHEPNLATAQGFTEHGESVPGSSRHGKSEPLTTSVSTSTLLTPPPQEKGEKVVVAIDEIEWPQGLTEEQKQACSQALGNIKAERRQAFADELAGAMGRRLIEIPAGWLRKLVKLEIEGGVVLELAPAIAQVRVRKAAAAEREAAAMKSSQPLPSKADASQKRGPPNSEAYKTFRAANPRFKSSSAASAPKGNAG